MKFPKTFRLLVVLLVPALLSSTAIADTAPSYPLKRRSTWNKTSGRNPFVPVGYTEKVANVTVAAPISPTLSADNFEVRSTLIGPPNMATINGKARSEGETFTVNTPGGPVQVQVYKVIEGAVQLKAGSEQITVYKRLR